MGHFFLRLIGLVRDPGHAGDLDASGKCAKWRSNVRRQLRFDHARSDIDIDASIFLLQNYPKKPVLILRQQSLIEIFCVTNPCERLHLFKAASAVTGAMYAGGFMARAL